MFSSCICQQTMQLNLEKEEQKKQMEELLAYWQQGFAASYNADRQQALALARYTASLAEAVAEAIERELLRGGQVFYLVSPFECRHLADQHFFGRDLRLARRSALCGSVPKLAVFYRQHSDHHLSCAGALCKDLGARARRLLSEACQARTSDRFRRLYGCRFAQPRHRLALPL